VICFVIVLGILTPPLGYFLARIFQGRWTILHPLLGWLEVLSYRLSGINPEEEMTSKQYIKAMLWFTLYGFIFIFFIQVFQSILPFNPQHFPDVPLALAFNTAISFVTNTNWQAYAGETTLSYASQMWGLTVQNFLSPAIGCATLMALIRGITGRSTKFVGNFGVDIVRSIIYIFLPFCFVFSLILVGQGVVQTLSPYVEVETLEGTKQTIPLGPVASQIAIKQLGTNGGGFFNTNSAHPFENPTAFSNFLETLALVLIPSSLVYAYGIMARSKRHAGLLLGVMFIMWGSGLVISSYSEHHVNDVLDANPVFEGKETRLGMMNSLLWATATTSTSNGSVNTMHSSLSPLAGGVTMFNIMLGELVFGGVGVGLSSMLMFVLLTVFLAGLMVGRTPEYMGKKIEKRDIQWVILAILAPSILILIGSGISSVLPAALSSLSAKGPHGLSELLYAFTSSAGNNGSSFAGINANTDYYNISLGVVMLLARMAILIPSLALAGLLGNKKVIPRSLGTLSTNTVLFGALLISVILIVGALTFFPALSLGPIIEHLLMLKGESFPFAGASA